MDGAVHSAWGLWDMAANHYVVEAFAHTSKPNMLRERMFAALEDPRAQEAADLARRAGLNLPPGWLFNDRRSMPLVPSLAPLRLHYGLYNATLPVHQAPHATLPRNQ